MSTILSNLSVLVGIAVFLIEIVAILAAIHAVMFSRQSQSAIAWAIALITFPFITLPLYLVFGRRKFHGYVTARRAGHLEIQHIAQNLVKNYPTDKKVTLDEKNEDYQVLERLAEMPFTGYNDAELLVNGTATFEAIFKSMVAAQDYILVQFFIVADDDLGMKLQSHMINKVRQGVRVYFLYDSIGCHALSKKYIKELIEAGVEVKSFKSSGKRRSSRFQINFRNHRKIVVVDGREAFVGGHNVSNTYVGLHPVLSPWRDTHVKVVGPAVQGVQLSFIEDWYWACRKVPNLNWTPEHIESRNRVALVLPSGPADALDTCSLFFVHSINSAKSRLWITSPYFVPDDAVMSALKLAAMRGVDVRIMLPEKPDHKLVYLATFSYINETTKAGIKMYRYKEGFLHQKVMLIDDDIATVGTANFDNRSFRLNFELTLLFADKDFAGKVEQMLLDDFNRCRQISSADIEKRSLPFKVAARVARLLSPIL